MTQFADSPEVIESKEETEGVTQEEQEREEVKGDNEEEKGKTLDGVAPFITDPLPPSFTT